MSSYSPPSQTLTVFNPTNYNYSTSTSLTQSTGDTRYIKKSGGTATGSVTFSSGLTSSANATVNSSLIVSKMGLFSGNVALNDNYLFLRSVTDGYHGLRYSTTLDGPVLWGSTGGALATLGGGNSLYWNSSQRVGIATTSPSYTLDVNGTVNCSSLRVNGIGAMRFAYGIESTSSSSGTTNFSTTFSSNPAVTCTCINGTTGKMFAINISSISTTQFSWIKMYQQGGSTFNATSEWFCWIAIGSS